MMLVGLLDMEYEGEYHLPGGDFALAAVSARDNVAESLETLQFL